MKVLITGGLGNLGAWLSEHLVKSGFDITTFGLRDRNVLRDVKVERLFGDVENVEELSQLFLANKWNAIIHLASVNETDTPNYFKKAVSVNALGTRNVLESLASSGSYSSHFIYFSTVHVYGLSSGALEEERTLPSPRSDYATSHLFAEHYVRQFHFTHGIPFTIFRLTNGYGAPKEIGNSKWHLLLNDLAKMAVENGVIKLNSNGLARRDFIWLGDVCDVVEKCLKNGAPNEIFNLGSGNSLRVLDVAEIVKKAYEDYFSAKIEIQINQSDESKHENELNVSVEKLRKWISFQPQQKIYEEATAIFDLLEHC